ncbi:LuxR C-terminal-related transcriptional regulator [uncultured Sphingomonas sp.]|uniref:helix-turn-helix transcriptional regulator n=1 Tax=uncultured Sphingomonas sp. TaxID=158754 RepID=UPI0026102F10|nr:LuxR C-terminal-related transcriptional regulator [uncultured Sphingomonas sp.]
MRTTTKSLELTDTLLKLLYGGPLEPIPWRGFLQALSDHVGCDNAAITLQLSRKGLAPMLIWGNDPPVRGEMARDIGGRHAEMGHMDPLRNALERSGGILLLEEVVSRETLLENEFCQTVLRPYGIEHALGMYVREPGGLECNFGLTSTADGVRFGKEHKDFMGLLRPHFVQALELFARIYRDESEIEVLTDALDRLTISTFMIDGRGKVLRANGAARELMARGEAFRILDGRLALNGRSDSARFRQIIEQALGARLSSDKNDYVRAFRCIDNGNEDLGVLVRAIRRDRLAPADLGPAVVVYVTDTGRSGSFKQLIATLFDLSPSEANLAALLTEGLTLAEAAREAGLTESTVRSYSKKIFAKLGVSRQTDLVRLILRSVAMLG